MNFWDILIIIIIALLVLTAVFLLRRRKNTGCSCGCENCAGPCEKRKESDR